METKLKDLGHEVIFLKRNKKNTSASVISILKTIIKRLLKYGFKEAIRQIKTFNEFKRLQSDFIEIKNNKEYFYDIEYFVLGSDTIWNLDSKYFEENYKIYFGGIFEDKKVITYAASVGNTKLEKIESVKDIPEMLEKLEKISVRDEETFKVVEMLSSQTPQLVCDPTLLLNKKEYSNIEKEPREKEKYIFLYLFSKLSKKHQEQLRNFADKNDLKIISGIDYMECIDKKIVNAPNTFLNYMMYAEYVITDTFHGTIFSINLQKNFLVIDRNKKKVADAMKRFDLNEKIINENADIEKAFTKKVDYDLVMSKLENFRKESEKFLKENLK